MHAWDWWLLKAHKNDSWRQSEGCQLSPGFQTSKVYDLREDESKTWLWIWEKFRFTSLFILTQGSRSGTNYYNIALEGYDLRDIEYRLDHIAIGASTKHESYFHIESPTCIIKKPILIFEAYLSFSFRPPNLSILTRAPLLILDPNSEPNLQFLSWF